MTTKMANFAAAAKLAAYTALLNGGSLEIRTGAPPTNAEDSATGTLLGTLAINATAFGAPSNTSGAAATATANAVTQDLADAPGKAGHYRAKKSDGTVVEQGLIDMPRPFTVTLATPGVFSSTAHGYADGTAVKLATTGALPTGLTAGTTYYVVSSATDSYRLALTAGSTAINTSGTQSGIHTATRQDADMVIINTDIALNQPIQVSSWTKTEPVLGA